MSLTFLAPMGRKQEPDPETIQKLLEENCHLIQCISDQQAKGRAAESAKYQSQLHRNLVWLATVADSNQSGSQSLMPATDLNSAPKTSLNNPEKSDTITSPMPSTNNPAPGPVVSHQTPMSGALNQGYIFSSTDQPMQHPSTPRVSSAPLDQLQPNQQQTLQPPQQQHQYAVQTTPMQYNQHQTHRPPPMTSYNEMHHPPPQQTYPQYHQQPANPQSVANYNDVMHQPKYPSHQVNYQQQQQQYQPGQYSSYQHQ